MVQIKEAGFMSVILLFLVSLGVNIDNYTNDEGIVIDEGYLPYTCAKETVSDMLCYKLSRVGTTGVNRNCYYDRDRGAKYKVCSTGWERIQTKEPDTCPVVDCGEPDECPVTFCPECKKCEVCAEPKECPVCRSGGGGGGGSCPSCPSCSSESRECTEIIGFVLTGEENYYCRNCGKDGCDACVSNEDIVWDMELHEFGDGG